MALLAAMVLVDPAFAQEISLHDAVRQAISSNLDLAAQRRVLAAAREEIGLARSPLLPQVEIGARAQLLEQDISDMSRNNREESVSVGADLSQVLYDEKSWAGFEIQKHIYDGQVQQLEAFELGVAQGAAIAFLELDRAQRVLEIQQENRELTRDNRETSRSRIAAGWSSDQEILRWDTQLAGNDTDVRAAEVLVLQNRFELNRARNRPPESPEAAIAATVEEYGFMYARAAIAKVIIDPDEDRRMRDVLVRFGLQRSPELIALDASIAAAERQLTSNRRAFWLPSFGLGAGIQHLTNDSNTADDFDKTEWDLRGEVTFPLFEGGAKFAGLEQTREALAGLRTQRRASTLTVDQSIRSAFAQASGAFASVGFAAAQVTAARRNFELVDASYILGVASILDLLDAQAERLTADLALANATYGFLENLVDAQREVSFYSFLEAPSDVEALTSEIERKLGLRP